MEHMSEVMQHLEHACARFEVSCMVPDAYCWVYISILTVKLHRFSPLNADCMHNACRCPARESKQKKRCSAFVIPQSPSEHASTSLSTRLVWAQHFRHAMPSHDRCMFLLPDNLQACKKLPTDLRMMLLIAF